MNERIIKEAIRQAIRSSYRFRVGAVIYDGNYIISRGYNKPNKTHPRANTPYSTIHAEFDAILKSQHYHTPGMLHNASIYVHRLWRTGQDGFAKPCQYCEVVLKQAGIKDINYSYGPKRIL